MMLLKHFVKQWRSKNMDIYQIRNEWWIELPYTKSNHKEWRRRL